MVRAGEELPPLIKPLPPPGGNGAKREKPRPEAEAENTVSLPGNVEEPPEPAEAAIELPITVVRVELVVNAANEPGGANILQVRCSDVNGEALLLHEVTDADSEVLGEIRVLLAERIATPEERLQLDLANDKVCVYGDGVDQLTIAQLANGGHLTLAQQFAELTEAPSDRPPSGAPPSGDGGSPAADGAADEDDANADGTPPEEPPPKVKPRRTAPEREEECDTAELALMTKLGGGDFEDRGRRKDIKGSEAINHVIWGLDINERGLTGSAQRATVIPWTAISRFLSVVTLIVVIIVFLTAMTRASFKQVAVNDDGLLLARGVPAFEGEEPIASTAAAIEVKELRSCVGLSEQALRHISDVELTYNGAWRSIRVARITKYSNSHIWLEAADGTGVRVQVSSVYLRLGKLGDEHRVTDGTPMAYFAVVASSGTEIG